MDSEIPQKNENAFRKWELERRWLIRGFWILVSLYIFVFIVCPLVYPLVYRLITRFIPIVPGQVIVPGVEEPWGLPMIILMGLLYFIILIVIRWRYIKLRLGKLSKGAAVFAAIVTAEDLERGNPVRATLSMDRLLSALSDFLGQKLVALGVSYVTPQDFMYVTTETIPRRAVRRAIQANEDTKDFQERLRNLAIGLHGSVDAGYLAAYQFLIWLDRKTESYQQESKSFLERRPALKTMLLNVFPVILPPLVGITIAVLAK